MAVVGNIIVSIGANTDDLLKGVNRAEGALAKVGRVALNIGATIAKAFAAAVVAVGALAIKGIALGNELARTARIVGLTAAELGGLHHAAALSEVSTEQLDAGLKRLGRTVSDASNGLKSATASIRELGLDANELERLPLSEQFLRVTDAMKGMTSQGDKLRIVTQLFGKSGAELIPLLDESSASIRNMMQESKALGLQLDETQSRVVQEASDSLDRMKGSFAGLSMQLGATFGPAIELAAETIANLTARVTQSLSKLSALASVFFDIRRAAEDMSDLDVSAELNEITLRSIELNKQLVETATRLNAMGPHNEHRIRAESRVNAILAEQLELEKRRNQLEEQAAQRMKEKEKPVESAAQRDLLETIDVTNQKIEVERSFSEVLEQMRRARLDDEIVVNAERIEAMRSWHEIELQMAQQHEGLLTEAHKEGVKSRIDFSRMEAGEKVHSVMQSLQTMTAGIAQHSKKAFQINKLAAIGNAIINTAQGVTKALATYPPPLSFAMAAAQAAAGAAQISAIKSTQFQGGGHGTTPSAAATPVVNDQPVAGSGTGGGGGGTIRVEGIDSNSLFTGRAMRELLERIQDALKDGGKLVIA